ncbi:MAG TPA: NAD-dependent epimerase/dehydratase family protein [Bacteroidales bacterium]|nr:NAD-dependent epimerase/dehydratase family protein [Bacteroidales bacterium]
MKIAVTGATGHVGTNLCRMLIDQGHEVKVLIRNDIKGLEGMPLEFIRGDISNESDLENLCSGCDVIYHLAAFISIHKIEPKCEMINIDGCLNVIRAARSKGVKRIIHFSSIHAFNQEPLESELNETRELALNSQVSYDYSKAHGQKLMMEASAGGPDVIVLNPTAIIGPNDFKPSLLGNAIIRFYKGQNPSLIPGGYNWVDVRDVCQAAVNAIHRGVPGECYLLGGSWQSLKTMAGTVEKLGGHKVPWLSLPMWIARLGAGILNLHARITKRVPLYTKMSLEALKHAHRNISSRKAKLVLDFDPRPFKATISDTIQWFKENRYI